MANPSDLFGDKGMKGVPYVVVNPATMRYILKEPAFVKVDFTDKNAMWKAGTVRGTIAGLMVLESSNLPTAGGYVNVFAGVKEATHYAIKTVTTRMMPAEDKFRMLWSTLYAAGVLVTQPKALVKVLKEFNGGEICPFSPCRNKNKYYDNYIDNGRAKIVQIKTGLNRRANLKGCRKTQDCFNTCKTKSLQTDKKDWHSKIELNRVYEYYSKLYGLVARNIL